MSSNNAKVPYYKVSFLNKWAICGGADGCEIYPDGYLSMDHAAPMRAPPKIRPKSTPTAPKPDAATKMLDDIAKIADTFSRFKKWLDTPDPPKTRKPSPHENSKAAAPFDIQEIPRAMQKLICQSAPNSWSAGSQAN